MSLAELGHWTMGRRMVMHRDSGLAVWWVLANAVGGTIVGFLEDSGFQFLATLVLTGLVLGWFQWLVLRQRFRPTWGWVPVSLIGWHLGMRGAIALSPFLDPMAQWLTALVGWEVFWLQTLQQPVVLGIMGFFQWLLLRRWSGQAIAWIPFSIVGGVAQGSISTVVCAIACAPLTQWRGAAIATGITYGAGWLAYGIVTATGLFGGFRLQSRR